MRRTFLFWLFCFMAATFVAAFVFLFFIQTRHADQNAVELIRLKLKDAKGQIQTNNRNLETIRQIVYDTALAKCRSFAEIIQSDPSILDDLPRCERLLKTLDVDELHVSNGDGILIMSIPEIYRGYDMSSKQQSAEFMPAITDPKFELLQAPQRKGADNKLFQYAGVARRDAPGIVQIGFFPSRLERAMELADVRDLAEGFRIGSHGTIVVTEGGKIVSDEEAWVGQTLADRGIDETNITDASGHFRADVFALPSDAAAGGGSGGTRKMLCLYENFDDYILLGLLPENEMYISRDRSLSELVGFSVLLFGVVFVLVSLLVERIVIRGIHKVNDSLIKITTGDLDEKVRIQTNAEFTLLSNGINTMVAALKDAIAETAERIDKELEFAQKIQLASLPSLFPPFPDRDEFDVYATMNTAKEVGGDFYDFMLIDDNHLGIIIADVSGKGIPAALFMMTTKTIAKNFAQKGNSPAKILTLSNDRLCEDNASGMFVTAFLGILEIDTGRFFCSSAGHNPPVLIRRKGGAEYMNVAGGIVLGGMAGLNYEQSEFALEPGDRIYFYTDGVTEALNTREELFGEERLLALLRDEKTNDLSLEELLYHIRQEVKDYADGAVQSDDITMMVLEVRKKQKIVSHDSVNPVGITGW